MKLGDKKIQLLKELEMKTRKVATIRTEIKKTEKELEGLRTELPKARSRTVDIKYRSDQLVYKSKVGDSKSTEKLAELDKKLDAAKLDEGRFEIAISQGQSKLETLEVELTESRKRTGLELIKKEGEAQAKMYTEVEEAFGVIISGVQKSRKGTDRLRENLDALDFEPLNIGTTVKENAARKISQILHELFPQTGLLFEGTLSKIHRESSLVQLIQNCFRSFSNSPKQLLQDPNEGVIRADLSEVRTVPSGEALLVAETRSQMKRDAAEMRSEGVPA